MGTLDTGPWPPVSESLGLYLRGISTSWKTGHFQRKQTLCQEASRNAVHFLKEVSAFVLEGLSEAQVYLRMAPEAGKAE